MQQANGGDDGGGGAMAPGGQWQGGFGGGTGTLIRSLLREVRPGDLITSDFMRRLLEGFATLEEYLGRLDNTVGLKTVPDVLFMTYRQALSRLETNDPPLKSITCDIFGTMIGPGNDKSFGETKGERIVLAQFPVPDAKILAHTPVRLVVSSEPNRVFNLLETVVTKGPEYYEAYQRMRNKGGDTPQPGGDNPTYGGANAATAGSDPAAAATPAGAASTSTAKAPADDPAALTPTKTPVTRSRARRKPAKPAGG
jgi:hypothetical protein